MKQFFGIPFLSNYVKEKKKKEGKIDSFLCYVNEKAKNIIIYMYLIFRLWEFLI